jgi:CheY-like chemotaxis protein
MPKILVIEDMPDSAELAAQILRNYGHEVFIAANGETGLKLAAEHIPDLIVYDYWLPDLDARTFLTRLRSDDALRHVKIVVCTATPQAVMQQSLGELGFDGYILKPYRLTNFMQAIEAHV